MSSILVFCRDYLIKDFVSATKCLHHTYNVHYFTDGQFYGVRDTRRRFYQLVQGGGEVRAILSAEEEDDIIMRCRLLRSIPAHRALRMLRAMLIVLEDELERVQPLVIIGQMIDEYVTHALSVLASRRHILYLGICASFFSGRMQVTKYAYGEPFVFRDVHQREVLDTLSMVSNTKFSQNYSHKISFSKVHHVLMTTRYYVKRILFPPISFIKRDPLGLHYLCLPYIAERRSFLDFYRKDLFDADWESKIANLRAGFARPVIFMPLSYSPESTNDYWIRNTRAIRYERMVLNICAVLSRHYIIAVKEHSHMVGIRSRNFYHQVNSISSVINVPPVVSSKSIFEIVDIALLGGGSIGVEAFLSDLPVATYCDTSYWHEVTSASQLDLGDMPSWVTRIQEAIATHQVATPAQHYKLIEYSLSSTARVAAKGKVWPIPNEDDMIKLVQTAILSPCGLGHESTNFKA